MSNRVSYFYDGKNNYDFSYIFGIIADVGSFYYGPEHPMKPFRIKMTH